MNDFNVGVRPEEVRKVALVGGGVIGGGWAVQFLARGLDVVVSDPAPGAEEWTRKFVAEAWPSMERLGLAPGADQARLSFAPSLVDAVGEADFVQESTPEDLELKKKVLPEIDAAARPGVVIASSTSNITPSALQASCPNPERIMVGHPYAPVYLIPLVEVVGGEKTAGDAVDWAMDFYTRMDKAALHCRREVFGHLGNRLQAAIRHEAQHLLEDGFASSEELDAALANGPGMRWALCGLMMCMRLGSGDKDIRGFARWINAQPDDPALSYLPRPYVSERGEADMVDFLDRQLEGRSHADLRRMMDDFLVGLTELQNEIAEKYGFRHGKFR